MLVVKLELWPFGDEKSAAEIGRAEIVNVTPGDGDTADYEYKVFDDEGNMAAGKVSGWWRKHNPAWHLVQRVINDKRWVWQGPPDLGEAECQHCRFEPGFSVHLDDRMGKWIVEDCEMQTVCWANTEAAALFIKKSLSQLSDCPEHGS